VRESGAEGKLLLDQNLAEEAVLLPDGKCQPRDADGDCADDVGEGFGHIVGVSYAGFWVEAITFASLSLLEDHCSPDHQGPFLDGFFPRRMRHPKA